MTHSKTLEGRQYVKALKAKDYEGCIKYTCTETEKYLKGCKGVTPQFKELLVDNYARAFHGVCGLYGSSRKREISFRLRKAFMEIRRNGHAAKIIEQLLEEVDNHEIIDFSPKQEKDLTLEEIMQPAHFSRTYVDSEFSPHGREKGMNGQSMTYNRGNRDSSKIDSGTQQY